MASTMKASSNQIAPCLLSAVNPDKPDQTGVTRFENFRSFWQACLVYSPDNPITGQVCKNHRLFANLVTSVWSELTFERLDQTTVPITGEFLIRGQRGLVSMA